MGLDPICSRGLVRCLQAEQCGLQPVFQNPLGMLALLQDVALPTCAAPAWR